MLTVSVMSLTSLPALYLEGDVETDGSFFACENNVDFVPCGWSSAFCAPGKRPMDYCLPTRPLSPAGRPEEGLIDFGREVFGFLHLTSAAPGAYTVYYGESAAEALAGKQGETWDAGAFLRAGEEVRLPSRAMRFVRVDGPADLSAAWLEEEYNGLPWRAAFSCEDERLNAIYDVSARTMELCTREFFLDGIKRDRWVWAGDALQSVLINHYSYLDRATTRRTLAALRGRDPFNQHINTILDYTFYWMMILEGFIAMVWAAGAMGVYNLGLQPVNAAAATSAVGVVCKDILGPIGGTIAIIGVIVLPITSGDTALRSLRMSLADTFHIKQQSNSKRLMLAVPVFALVAAIIVWAKMDSNGFNTLWRYFAWSNQTLSLFAFLAITVWMFENGKGKWCWIPLIPGCFYAFICSTYIANATIGFHLPWNIAYIIGVVFAIAYVVVLVAYGSKRGKKVLSAH